MACFVLFPCKLRQDQLVPLKDGERIMLDWPQLCERFAPSHSKTSLLILRHVRVGAFIGLVRRDKAPSTFYLFNPDRSGSLHAQLKKDPTLTERFVEAFRVDDVTWDASVTELGVEHHET